MLSSTAVLGGAQILMLLINVIRGKFVALILHASGIGVMSLLTNAANTIQQFALMGINISAVRSISQAGDTDDKGPSQALVIRLVRMLILITSTAGLFVTLLLSPLLSELSFKSSEYTPYFLLLSLFVFFNMLGTGEATIAQGLRRYKLIAKSSIIPSVCGLFLSIPIYYIWGMQGIVPAMILTGALYFMFIRWNFSHGSHAIPAYKARVSIRELWTGSKDIIKFGAIMMIGTLVGTITTFLIIIFIRREGSLADVGFYQAANTITFQYTSIIFTAMATDFYPQLSSLVKESQKEAFSYTNQQIEIVLLVIAPLTMLTILAAPLAIHVLLTSEFLQITTMVRLIALATIFKAACFPMDYIAYAKGDKTYIFWIETIWGNLKTFIILAGSYYFMHLDGLGYGVLCSAVIDFIVSIVLTRYRYGFKLSTLVARLMVFVSVLGIVCLLGALIPMPSIICYGVMLVTAAVSCTFCLILLDRRVGMRNLAQKLKSRRKT